MVNYANIDYYSYIIYNYFPIHERRGIFNVLFEGFFEEKEGLGRDFRNHFVE